MFLHTVLFWLKDDLTEADGERFLRKLKGLTTIKGVEFSYIGQPAPTRRPVVDSSYSYKLVVGFADLRGHDAYQEDLIHLAFIQDCAPLWTRVQVYDAEAIA